VVYHFSSFYFVIKLLISTYFRLELYLLLSILYQIWPMSHRSCRTFFYQVGLINGHNSTAPTL